MHSEDGDISHVSDTALMVAAARALETARPDGLVHDPFAERLAGARGKAMLQGVERTMMLTFGVGIRSRFMDELLLELVGGGRIDTVINLGCGLDTRPWRLELPAELHWIEVDLPAMLEYKSSVLAADAPRCRLERIAADLSEAGGRAAAFAGAGSRTLLITEGLLMYLSGETVEAIAECAARAAYWMVEVSSPEFARRVGMSTCQSIENVRAAGSIDGVQTLRIIERHGWKQLAERSYARDVMTAAPERVKALMQARLAAGAPPPEPPPAGDPSGVHLFERAERA